MEYKLDFSNEFMVLLNRGFQIKKHIISSIIGPVNSSFSRLDF